jgi:AAA15 family ATPase/GTPase
LKGPWILGNIKQTGETMTTLNHLTIKNFRGFDSLEIDGLSKINLFVGKNNVGKTSILESLFLVIGMSYPVLPHFVNQIRGLNVNGAKELLYLFHNLSDTNKPTFQAKLSDASKRILRLEPKYNQNEFASDNSSQFKPKMVGLDLNFQKIEKGQDHSFKSSLLFENGMINQTIPQNYNEKLHAVFVAEKNDLAALTRFSEMKRQKKADSILDVLQKFDNNIKGITTLQDGIYFDINGAKELIPCSIMGDGIRRFLNIATAVFEEKNSLVCIDEIENGLHYSAYKLLWKSLLSFSNQNDTQLFITTHNIETLACLKSVLEEPPFETMQEYAKVFTVSKTVNSGYKSYRYSFEGFKDAIDLDAEIRG